MNTVPVTGQVEHLAFSNERLTLVWEDEDAFVAIKPICERLGLAYQPQHRKLMAPESGSVVTMMVTTGADGKQYDMTCLHALDVPVWLGTISASRVKPELREGFAQYRLECRRFLRDHLKSHFAATRRAFEMASLRYRMDLISRKPLWVRMQQFVVEGYDFEDIRHAVNRPARVVREALGDLLRLGFIDALPAGTNGATYSQMVLFADAPEAGHAAS